MILHYKTKDNTVVTIEKEKYTHTQQQQQQQIQQQQQQQNKNRSEGSHRGLAMEPEESLLGKSSLKKCGVRIKLKYIDTKN